MQASGFRSTPLTRTLLFLLLSTSLLTSLTSTKPLYHLQLAPHILTYSQYHRIALFQLLYTNSGELLFGILLLYHLRLLERLFGSRKFLSLVLYAYAATSLFLSLALGIGYLLAGWNYIPPGPTPVLFALLAQWHAVVPGTYTLRVDVGAGKEVEVTDKVFVYAIAAQLAGCQAPGSLVGAVVGWVVGYAWRLELLPGCRWRVGGWAVKLGGGEEGRGYEGLRRRLQGQEERAEGGYVWRVLGMFRGQG